MGKRIVFASLLLLTLGGCATTDGYREFYTPMSGVTSEKLAAMRAGPAAADPKLVHLAGRFDQAAQREYAREGYEVIGYSSFTSGNRQDDDDAVGQAQKVGADLVVIIGSEYAGSVTSSVPLTTPTATTSYTNGMATAYGTGGSAVAFGNSTTTTYGTSTTYVPMTVNRYQYGALYLVKVRLRLGVKMRVLSDQERRELQTNHGVYIETVVDGTPAYQSDILPGDVITTIDGSRIDDPANFNELLSARVGQTVELAIIRQGKAISKTVALRQ
jgi:PDZ domain